MNSPIAITSNENSKTTGFLARIKSVNRLLLVTVLLPTLLAIVYFGFIASDVYISESRFIIRSPEQQSASPLGFILKGAGFTRSQDDSYTVQDFIESRDAMRALHEQMNLRKAFGSKRVDIFSRFPGLDWDDSLEAFYKYYEKHVNVQLDSVSSIAILTTRAFTADDSFRMNQSLLEMSESLVNRLNERARQDMIRFATQEVADAEKKAKAAALALARYRNVKGVINPEKQSAIPLQQAAKLQDELIATQVQIAQLEKVAKKNPQLPVLRQQARLLEQAIQAETNRVAGKGDRSLASKAAEYQRLALDSEFADKMLASAMNTLEQARNEAQRKQLYLERIAAPSVPDKAMEPHRVRNILATFLLGLILWGVLTIVIGGVREHYDR
ncbi:MAG: capsule biosynthesis protein [Thiobacillaceae bacterium]